MLPHRHKRLLGGGEGGGEERERGVGGEERERGVGREDVGDPEIFSRPQNITGSVFTQVYYLQNCVTAFKKKKWYSVS